MPQIAIVSTGKIRDILAADGGVPAAAAALALQQGWELPPIESHQILSQNVAPELLERSTANKYPLIHTYCSKIANELREKFRAFSGTAEMVIEVRVSHDRLEGVETQLQAFVDATIQVLTENRGDWGDGMLYGGGYEIAFGAVKHGGSNFIQIAKISFVLEISTD